MEYAGKVNHGICMTSELTRTNSASLQGITTPNLIPGWGGGGCATLRIRETVSYPGQVGRQACERYYTNLGDVV